MLEALRTAGHLPALAALVEWWSSILHGQLKPPGALSALYCQLAQLAPSADTARDLARIALDLTPESFEALSLYEQHARPEDDEELCERYRAFLHHAPFRSVSPRVRVRLIDKLVEAGRYKEAAEQVANLPPRSALRPGEEDVQRACQVPEEDRFDAPEDASECTQVLDMSEIEVVWQDEDENPPRHSEIRLYGSTNGDRLRTLA